MKIEPVALLMKMIPIQVSPRLSAGLRVFWTLAAVALLAFAAHAALGFGGPGLDAFFQDWVYNGVTLGRALACLLRAYAVREERLPWLVMGIGLLAWTGGDLYWTFVLADDPAPPTRRWATRSTWRSIRRATRPWCCSPGRV